MNALDMALCEINIIIISIIIVTIIIITVTTEALALIHIVHNVTQ